MNIPPFFVAFGIGNIVTIDFWLLKFYIYVPFVMTDTKKGGSSFLALWCYGVWYFDIEIMEGFFFPFFFGLV